MWERYSWTVQQAFTSQTQQHAAAFDKKKTTKKLTTLNHTGRVRTIKTRLNIELSTHTHWTRSSSTKFSFILCVCMIAGLNGCDSEHMHTQLPLNPRYSESLSTAWWHCNPYTHTPPFVALRSESQMLMFGNAYYTLRFSFQFQTIIMLFLVWCIAQIRSLTQCKQFSTFRRSNLLV